MELAAQAPALDSLLVPVGGGGLIGGIAAWPSIATGMVALVRPPGHAGAAVERHLGACLFAHGRDAAVGRPPFSRGLEHTRAKIPRGM